MQIYQNDANISKWCKIDVSNQVSNLANSIGVAALVLGVVRFLGTSTRLDRSPVRPQSAVGLHHQNPHYTLNTAANISGGSRARKSNRTGPSRLHWKPAPALDTHSDTTPPLSPSSPHPNIFHKWQNSGLLVKYGATKNSLLELLANHYHTAHVA